MAKKKNSTTETDIDITPAETTEMVENWAQSAEPETTSVEPTVVSEPVKAAEPAPAPKRRIRIRKKATKKLSAAIICKDPTIQRFI